MTQLTREQLIEKLEAADSKEALEELADKHLGTDVDKRHGIESIRADLVEMAEDGGKQSGPSTESQTDQDDPQGSDGNDDVAAEQDTGNDDADQNASSSQEAGSGGPSAEHVPATTQLPRQPKVDPATNGSEPGATQSAGEGKRGRVLMNTQNGRRMVWTAALAELPYMKEV